MADPDPIEKTTSEMPEPNPAALETAESQTVRNPPGGETKSDGDTLRDLAGNAFDASIHETESDGSPRVSARGKLIRKRGRGSANFNPNASKSQVNVSKTAGVGPTEAGKAAADAVIMAGIMLGGPEWVPKGWSPSVGQNESELMAKAFTDYFEAKDIGDNIPPGMALTIACLGYAGPRLFMPETKSRLQLYWLAIKSKLAGKGIGHFRFKGEKDNASTDSRADNERQNDTGKEDGA